MQFYRLKISEVVTETAEAVSLYFDIPESLKEIFTFKPGQYLTLKSIIKGEEVRRAYSICSSILENRLGVTVKKVRNGKMSNFIHDQIRRDDEIEVLPPEGRFVVEANHDNTRDHYFFAAGSGITPVMSMILSVLEEEPKSNCYLFYGNRNEKTIIFKDKLDALEEKYKGQFFLTHILSKPTTSNVKGITGFFKKPVTSWNGQVGRITPETANRFLEEHAQSNQEQKYYLCGPGAMIESLENAFVSQGIDKKNILQEYFTTPQEEKSSKQESPDIAKVITTLEGEIFEVEVPASKTILDALLDMKKDPPYSCTSGACSTCICKVSEGKVTMDVCYALDEDEIEEGYVLACQAHPATETVEITFDV